MCNVKSLPVMLMLLTYRLEHTRNGSGLSNKKEILLRVHVCCTGVDNQMLEGKLGGNHGKGESRN